MQQIYTYIKNNNKLNLNELGNQKFLLICLVSLINILSLNKHDMNLYSCLSVYQPSCFSLTSNEFLNSEVKNRNKKEKHRKSLIKCYKLCEDHLSKTLTHIDSIRIHFTWDRKKQQQHPHNISFIVCNAM